MRRDYSTSNEEAQQRYEQALTSDPQGKDGLPLPLGKG